MRIEVPVPQAPFLDSNNQVTRVWRQFFIRLAGGQRNDTGALDDLEVLASAPTAESAISDLEHRVSQLEEALVPPVNIEPPIPELHAFEDQRQAVADLQAMVPPPVDVGGKVDGPLSATDNAIARFDGTTGKKLQNSIVIVDDTGGIVGVLDMEARSIYLRDTNASHFLRLIPGSDLTAARTLTLTTGDADRTITLAGDLTTTEAVTLSSGTYTPTLTNVANVAASTAYECQYLRVGVTVVVSGRVDIDPTLTATSTQLGVSLPIASNLGASSDVGGTAFSTSIASMGAGIQADTANDRAAITYISTDITNQDFFFVFAYQVI